MAYPTLSEFQISTQMTEAYLQVYQRTGEIHLACQAAIDVAQATLSEEQQGQMFHNPIFAEYGDQLKKIWGFTEYYPYYFSIGDNWRHVCRN